MVTASQLTENPAFIAASEKAQLVFGRIASLPMDVWRNLLVLLSSIWICHTLASLFWLVFPTPEVPQPKQLAAIPVQVVSASGESFNIDAIKAMNLFGVQGAAPVATAEPVKPKPNNDIDSSKETRLNLKLQGIIASSIPEHARAIIDDNKEQLLIRIGEELPRNKGVKLARVMTKKVILDNKGSYESLTLYDEKSSVGAVSNKPAYKVPKKGRSERGDSGFDKKTTVSRERVPKSISDIVRFSVHREGGQMVGYRVRPGRERELFDEVGLKPNDIVTTVNGIHMDDPSQLKAVYQSLKTATEADLGVLRNGEELSISISVEGN